MAWRDKEKKTVVTRLVLSGGMAELLDRLYARTYQRRQRYSCEAERPAKRVCLVVFSHWSLLLPELRGVCLGFMSSSTRLLLGMTSRAERAVCRRDREPELVEALIMEGQHGMIARVGLTLRKGKGTKRLINTAIANGHLATLQYLVSCCDVRDLGEADEVATAINHGQWPTLEWIFREMSLRHFKEEQYDEPIKIVFGAPLFVLFKWPYELDRYLDYMRDMGYGRRHALFERWRGAVLSGDLRTMTVICLFLLETEMCT